MTNIEAFVLPPRNSTTAPARIGGLAAAERTVLALYRGGIDRIVVSAGCDIDVDTTARLVKRGVPALLARDAGQDWVTPGAALVAVSCDVVFEPAAVRALVAKLAELDLPALAAVEACAPGVFAAFRPSSAQTFAAATSKEDLFGLFDALRVVRLGGAFCRVASTSHDTPGIERAYIRRSNGVESPTTQIARFFSLPLSRAFLRLGMSANHVTLLGLGFAGLSAPLFASRLYWPGIAGALLYYVSMVLDCSDGEVARASLSDSKLGAWLETVTDYLSYFLVMGGLVVGELRHHGLCHHVEAATVAAAASLAIVLIVGYLRGRLASANPGAFDDALSAEMSKGTLVQRFAVWGRQLIKRSFFAHLIVFQALIGHLAALLEIWAYGSVGALLVLIAVYPALIERLKIAPARVPVTISIRED